MFYLLLYLLFYTFNFRLLRSRLHVFTGTLMPQVRTIIDIFVMLMPNIVQVVDIHLFIVFQVGLVIGPKKDVLDGRRMTTLSNVLVIT